MVDAFSFLKIDKMKKRIHNVFLIAMVIMLTSPLSSKARTYKGTINIEVGESYHVDLGYSSGYTVSGYWTKTGGSAFVITSSSSGNGGCTIKGNTVGTSTLNWKGVVSGGWSTWDEEYYWTVNVSPEPSNDDSGACGENLTYTYKDATKTLTISGTGAMNDYSGSGGQPWWSYKTDIKNLVIGPNVTYLGECAFYSCTGLTNVSMADGVTNIGKYCFHDCI